MSTLRVVSYAINGRGMGHLVRQLAILRWVKRITSLLGVKSECWILTSSEADTLARREGIAAFKMPSKAMMRDAGIDPTRHLALVRTWVLNVIAGLRPDLLVVDTFPGGSFGELVPALELAKRRVLVARRVREDFAATDPYQPLLSLYHQEIHPDARGTGPILIRERSEIFARDEARRELGIGEDESAVYLTLGGGGDEAASSTLPRLSDALVAKGWHVVVGAGPLYQGPERRGPRLTWLSRYCPLELFSAFDAAVSAGGYNTFHELMFAGVPTVFLPQPRIADDQAARVESAVAAKAGRVARSLDEVIDLLEDPGEATAARGLVSANGAKLAALSLLAPMLPSEDLAFADRLLDERVVGRMHAFRAQALRSQALRSEALHSEALHAQAFEPGEAMTDLLRLAADGRPSDDAKLRATLASLAERGHAVPDLPVDGSDPSRRFLVLLDLVERHAVPLESAVALGRGLRRKFPASEADSWLAALEILVPVWAAHGDWMGAVSLLRAIPVQRGYAIEAFAHDMIDWLAHHDDLFDALRELSRALKLGERPLREVFGELAARRREEAAQ